MVYFGLVMTCSKPHKSLEALKQSRVIDWRPIAENFNGRLELCIIAGGGPLKPTEITRLLSPDVHVIAINYCFAKKFRLIKILSEVFAAPCRNVLITFL